MKKISFVMFVLMCLMVTGCDEDIDYSIYPEHFASILEDYDLQYEKRYETYETEDIYRCYQLDDGHYYFVVKTWGYEEDMLIGVEMTNSQVLMVSILFENESDKYGEYVVEDWFLERFIMSKPAQVELVKKQKKQDFEVVAITGATITSQAVVDGVNGCIMIMEDSQ